MSRWAWIRRSLGLDPEISGPGSGDLRAWIRRSLGLDPLAWLAWRLRARELVWGAQYSDALLAYRDLLAQVDVLEQRMASMAGNEHLLLRAVEDQHALIDTLRQQVATMTESLGLLLGGVERNKSILALMSDAAAQVRRYSFRRRTSRPEWSSWDTEARRQAAAHNPVSVSARLSTLEARIGDMADAVAALARAQTLMAHGAVTPAGRAAAGREGPAAVGSRRQSSTGRESSGGRRHVAERHVAERHVAEKIEKLPNPVHLLSTRGSSWKP
ncbi:hypothetical protein PLESTB_000350400 [Pleodorina starrii]|uniref:Uncharacterized protein n=1 Tax=Pleodorina starrii TaxID=330485 RepID=A0A9W6EYW2_9CHLO|nr:hypothetical protein PLESTB_000350400 [Pleodorina starrii]